MPPTPSLNLGVRPGSSDERRTGLTSGPEGCSMRFSGIRPGFVPQHLMVTWAPPNSRGSCWALPCLARSQSQRTKEMCTGTGTPNRKDLGPVLVMLSSAQEFWLCSGDHVGC